MALSTTLDDILGKPGKLTSFANIAKQWNDAKNQAATTGFWDTVLTTPRVVGESRKNPSLIPEAFFSSSTGSTGAGDSVEATPCSASSH